MFMTGVLCTVCGAQVYFLFKLRSPSYPHSHWLKCQRCFCYSVSHRTKIDNFEVTNRPKARFRYVTLISDLCTKKSIVRQRYFKLN